MSPSCYRNVTSSCFFSVFSFIALAIGHFIRRAIEHAVYLRSDSVPMGNQLAAVLGCVPKRDRLRYWKEDNKKEMDEELKKRE